MRCRSCGTEPESKYYFVDDSLCRDCFAKLGPAEQKEVLAGAERLAREEVGPRTIAGRPLHCPVCGHGQFWKRWTLMNTPGLTFFGVEWANKQAENFVCASCGHVLWFLRE
jgi:hypothetical protein